jgi:hypothetical protein
MDRKENRRRDSVLDTEFDELLRSAEVCDDVHEGVGMSDDDRLVVDRNLFTRRRNGVNGFGVIPIWALKEMVRTRAYHAIALAIVLFQHMRMRKTKTVPITGAVWAKIGSPSEYERKTILKHLRRVPGVLRLEERHKGYTRYQVTLGNLWTK